MENKVPKKIEEIIYSVRIGSTLRFKMADWDTNLTREIEIMNTCNGPIETARVEIESLISGMYGMMVSIARRTRYERISGYERIRTNQDYALELYKDGVMIQKIEDSNLEMIFRDIEMNIIIEQIGKNFRKTY